MKQHIQTIVNAELHEKINTGLCKMFDFNQFNIKEGSKIIGSSGTILYTVEKVFHPTWDKPIKNYLNSNMYLTVTDLEGCVFSQPIQWFNAVILANTGVNVI